DKDTDEGREDESLDVEDKREGSDDEGLGLDDEGLGLDDEDRGLEDEGHSLNEGDEAAPEGQQQVVLTEDTAVGEPLGLGYRVLRRCALAEVVDQVLSTFEVGQSSGSMPEP
nr:hypothetical protein [Tanacetum cinerariifolium]